MAKRISLFRDGQASGGLTFNKPESPSDPYAQAVNYVDDTRATLAGLGLEDPTRKKGPSALERIFGPLDALGAGVRAGVYNLISPDDKLSVLGEMGKALKGEKRVEGGDILEELGVQNKWGKLAGGFLVDVALDPLTYLTFGFGSATKSAGKSFVTAAAQYGDDAARIAEALGKNADEVEKVLSVLRSAGHFDEAGKLGIASLGKDTSRALMTDVYKSLGTGGVKFAGIPLGGEKAVSSLGFKAKDVARKLPGSRWIEQTFTMGDLPGEAVDLFREGNEAVNAVVKSLRRKVQGRLAFADNLGTQFAAKLTDLIPDARTRQWVSLAMGRQFGDVENMARLADAFAAVGKATDDAGRAAAAANLQTVREGILAGARDRIIDTLRTADLPDDELGKALEAVSLFEGQFDDLLRRQREAGAKVPALFGEGPQGYLPGLPLSKPTEAAKGFYDEAFGFAPETLGEQSKQGGGFFSRHAPKASKEKTFLTPEMRVQGLTREGDEVAGIATEFDLARLGGAGTAQAERNIALGEFQQELTAALGGGGEVGAFAADVASKVRGFFTDDEATKSFLSAYDKALNTWKKAATVYRFPAFPARNGITNKLQMFQDGMLSAAGESESLAILGRLKTGAATAADEKLLAEAIQDGVFTTAAELAETVGKSTPVNRLTKMLSSVNELVENQSRLSAYITAKNKGLDRLAASEMVDKALLRYSDQAYSVFERNVIKRIIPFYKWTKGNLSKQVRVLFESPGRSTWLGHLKESGEAAAEYDPSVMPEWMRDLFPIPLPVTDPDTGQPAMLSTVGLFPQGDLELLSGFARGEVEAKDLMGLVNPLIRDLLIEFPLNQDIYREGEIERYEGEKRRAPTWVEEFGDVVSGSPAAALWGAVAERLGIEEREDDGEAYYYMSAKAVKALNDFIPWMNYLGRNLGSEPRSKYDRFFSATGMRLSPYEAEKFARQQTYDDRAELMETMQRARDEGLIVPSAPARKKVTLQEVLGRAPSRSR